MVRPYVERVEVLRDVGRVGAGEGVRLAHGDLPGVDGLQAVTGVICKGIGGDPTFLNETHNREG